MSIFDIVNDVLTPEVKTDTLPLQRNRQTFETAAEDINAAIFNAPFNVNFNKLKQYKTSVWVYVAVSAIAKAISSIPYDLVQGDNKDDQKVLETHAVIDLLKKPNQFTTFAELMFATSAYINLHGNTFWILLANNGEEVTNNNLPDEIWIVNPDRVIVIPDSKEYVGGYLFTVNGQSFKFHKDEVVHFKNFNPNNDFYGQSPLQPLTSTLKSEHGAIDYNAAFYENSSIPEGVLTTDQLLTTPVRKRLEGEWAKKHGGKRRSHRMAILELGLEYKAIQMTQKDADFIESRKMNRSEILAVYGVPPVIAGLETQNFATAREQRLIYWEETIIPGHKAIGMQITEMLIPLYGDDNLKLVPNLSESPALKIYQERNEERAIKLKSNGLMSGNEARTRLLNLDKSDQEGMDTIYQQANLIPVGTGEVEVDKDEKSLTEGLNDWESDRDSE